MYYKAKLFSFINSQKVGVSIHHSNKQIRPSFFIISKIPRSLLKSISVKNYLSISKNSRSDTYEEKPQNQEETLKIFIKTRSIDDVY